MGQVGGTDAAGLNRRQALGLGAAATAGVGAAATAAPAAAGSGRGGGGNEAMLVHMISYEQAQEVIEAALEYVRENELPPMFVIVVDACGDEKASARMDGNGAASVVLAPVKARTSAAFRAPTAVLAQNVTDPAAVASFTTAGFSLLGGGHPLTRDEMVIGAIGVGGGSPAQDALVAEAAAAAVG